MINDLSKLSNESGEEEQRCVTRLSWLLKRICLHAYNHDKIYNKEKLIKISSVMKMTRRQRKWCGGNGVDLRTCMQPLLQHQRLDQVFHQPRRWTHQCCGWWHRFSPFSGYDIVGKGKTTPMSTMMKWRGIDSSVWTSEIHNSSYVYLSHVKPMECQLWISVRTYISYAYLSNLKSMTWPLIGREKCR